MARIGRGVERNVTSSVIPVLTQFVASSVTDKPLSTLLMEECLLRA